MWRGHACQFYVYFSRVALPPYEIFIIMAFYLYKHISYAIFPSRIGDIKYYTFLVQIMNNEIIKECNIFGIFLPCALKAKLESTGSRFITIFYSEYYDVWIWHSGITWLCIWLSTRCIISTENIFRRRNQKFVKVDDAPWMKHGF